MFGELFTQLRRAIGDDSSREDEGDETGFAGSLLDLSVIVGHGGGNAEGERELESVAEEADRLSEARDR